jgi:hypothetical protein
VWYGHLLQAIVFSFFSVVGAVVRQVNLRDSLPWKSVLSLLISAICGMCAFSIWIGGVEDDLNKDVEGESAFFFFLSFCFS